MIKLRLRKLQVNRISAAVQHSIGLGYNDAIEMTPRE